MRRRWQWVKDEKGNVFLEHAFLTLPILILGVVLLANAALVVSSAAASGARVAARAEDSDQVIEAVQKELQAGGLSTSSPQFQSESDIQIQFYDGAYCTVRVYYHFQFPFSFHKVGITVDETIDFSAGSSFLREW